MVSQSHDNVDSIYKPYFLQPHYGETRGNGIQDFMTFEICFTTTNFKP